MLRVSEIFASVQGEGPSVGQPAIFLRLARCNLACTWCDTPYSWDWDRFSEDEETETLSVEDAAARIDQLAQGTIRLLVITGGEPLLQQRPLARLLAGLAQTQPQMRSEVETNGTVRSNDDLAARISLFVVSPKLANSGIEISRRIRPRVLRAFTSINSVLKFVLTGPSQAREAAEIAKASGFGPDRVWLMPEGTEPGIVRRRMSELAPTCQQFGFSLSPRLHVLMWGDRRGT